MMNLYNSLQKLWRAKDLMTGSRVRKQSSPNRRLPGFEQLENRQLLTVALTQVTSLINSANATSTMAGGTGDVGANISVVATDGVNVTAPIADTVGADGTWSVSGIDVSGLRDGTITFVAADITHGPPTVTLTATKDTIVPVAIVSLVNPFATGGTGTATAQGVGEVGATVSLVASDGVDSTAALTTTVRDDGTWKIAGINLQGLSDGTITITVMATDAAGNDDDVVRTTKKIAADGELSGFVYVDSNKNGRRNSNEAVLKGVMITLIGVDNDNVILPSRTTTTASDGSYRFTGLLPGTYTLQEVQPAYLNSQKASAGTLGGKAKSNIITDIEVESGDLGRNYNFGEKGLKSSAGSLKQFLASSSQGQKQLNDAVSKGGAAAPVVKSIRKLQADPTASTSVKYEVKFNKPVKGVDKNDFLLLRGGPVGATITRISGSASKYTVTIKTGDRSGTLGLAVVDNDTIVDKSRAPLGGKGFGNGAFFGSSYTISKAPALTVASLTDPINSANAANISITGTGESGAVLSFVVSDGTEALPATFFIIPASGNWSINGVDVTSLGDGPLTFTFTALNGAGKSTQIVRSAQKDTTSPAVASIVPADTTPTSSLTLHFNVEFNQPVSASI